jgi:hypothetical protein
MIVYVASVTGLPENLLPHILRHYQGLGVGKFIFGVYGGRLSAAWKELEEAGEWGYLIELHEIFDLWNPCIDGDFKNRIRIGLSVSDWILPADVDEFHIHLGYNTFLELAKVMEEDKADYVVSWLEDRIKEDGSIPVGILRNVPLLEQFPRKALISKEIMNCYTGKTIMLRPQVPISPGHHLRNYFQSYRAFGVEAVTYHFKWYGNLREREEIKADLYKRQNQPWYKEQLKLFQYLDVNGGRFGSIE